MEKKAINIHMDGCLKDQAEKILEDIGISIPEAIKMFLKAVVREQGIPFAVTSGITGRKKNREQEELKYSLVGTEIIVKKKNDARQLLSLLHKEGYSVYMSRTDNESWRVTMYDYLQSARQNENGFFSENAQLLDCLRRELRREPYNRKDGDILHFLLTEKERSGNEDVIGFCPGKQNRRAYYHTDYRYVTSGVFLYSNLEACIKLVIPGFDIYGNDRRLSWDEWEIVKKAGLNYGGNTAAAVQELDAWLQDASLESDTAMTVLCI